MSSKIFSRVREIVISGGASFDFFLKVAANFFQSFLNVVIQSLAARNLGPENLGAINLLQNSTLQFYGVLDCGASQWLATKFAQGHVSEAQKLAFSIWSSLGFFLLHLTFYLTTQINFLFDFLWTNQFLPFVQFGFTFFAFLYLANAFNMMLEYSGKIKSSIFISLSNRILLLSSIWYFVLGSRLSPKIYAFAIGAVSLLSVAGIIFLLFLTTKNKEKASKLEVLFELKVIFEHVKPVFLSTVVFCFLNLFDRWCLNRYHGNIANGNFALSSQLSQIIFVLFSAIVAFLPRKIGAAITEKKTEKIEKLFDFQIKSIFLVLTFVCMFFSIFADKFVFLFGGGMFSGALSATVVMIFAPIFQCVNQIGASYLLIAGKNKINIFVSLSVFVFASPLLFALVYPTIGNLSVVGLAIKILFVQFFSANILYAFVCKELQKSPSGFYCFQVLTTLVLFASGLLARYANKEFEYLFQSGKLALIFSSIIYLLVGIIFIWLAGKIFFPRFIEELRLECKKFFAGAKQFLFSKLIL